MKAIFPLSALRAACEAISPVVPSRTTRDILKNIKLVANGEICSVSATDSEMSIVAFIRGVQCSLNGVILLPCEKFRSILREVSGDTITIEFVNGIANILAGRSKFKIPTEDASGFPDEPVFPESNYRTISTSSMQMIAKRCSVFSDSTRFHALAGIQFEVKETLTAVSTDTNCLSLAECAYTSVGSPTAAPAYTVVPPKAVKILSSVIDGEGGVDLSITDNAITARSGDIILTAQLIGGKFPDWRKIIPASPPHHIDIPSPQLSSALRQAIITTAEESACVDFSFAGGTLSLKSSGKGESTIEIPVGFSGECGFTMDPKFVLSALTMIDKTSSVDIGVIDADAPVLLTSNDGLKFIAMPASRN